MYCRKCGKEIDENSRFCSYCGFDLTVEQGKGSDTAKQDVQPQKTDKSVSLKKWIVFAMMLAGIVIVGAAVLLGMRAARRPEETPKTEVIEESSEEQKEPAEEKPEEYPQEITMDENTQQKIIEFLELLCEVDTAGSEGDSINRMYGCTVDDAFAYSYLFQSLQNEISFSKDEPFSGWSVPEETVSQYLQNSINHPEYECNPNGVKIEDGTAVFEMASGELLSYGYTTPKIDKITRITEDEIEITGSVDYTRAEIESNEPYTSLFDIVMFENPESIWGGYTLKEIKSWERQEGEEPLQNEYDPAGDWKQAFIDYIDPAELHEKTCDYEEETYSDTLAFKLWDMDQDGTPEVVCTYGGGSGAGAVLLAYNPQSNTIVESGLGRFLTYDGKELCGGNSHGGVGWAIVYTKNEDGSLREEFSYEFQTDLSSDSYKVNYYCNEFEITEEEYQQFSDRFSQQLEMDLTYDGLIWEIQNYAG